MYTLHCTQRLRDRLKRPLASDVPPASTVLGNWYATVLFWKPQLALLVNERTLLPALLPLAPAGSLPERVGPELRRVLDAHGIDPAFIEREVAAMAEVVVAKTSNRRVVGTMNEFAFEAKVYRELGDASDLVGLAIRLAKTPCGAIGYNSPARLLQEIAAPTAR
jgi:hypothetical protein